MMINSFSASKIVLYVGLLAALLCCSSCSEDVSVCCGSELPENGSESQEISHYRETKYSVEVSFYDPITITLENHSIKCSQVTGKCIGEFSAYDYTDDTGLDRFQYDNYNLIFNSPLQFSWDSSIWVPLNFQYSQYFEMDSNMVLTLYMRDSTDVSRVKKYEVDLSKTRINVTQERDSVLTIEEPDSTVVTLLDEPKTVVDRYPFRVTKAATGHYEKCIPLSTPVKVVCPPTYHDCIALDSAWSPRSFCVEFVNEEISLDSAKIYRDFPERNLERFEIKLWKNNFVTMEDSLAFLLKRIECLSNDGSCVATFRFYLDTLVSSVLEVGNDKDGWIHLNHRPFTVSLDSSFEFSFAVRDSSGKSKNFHLDVSFLKKRMLRADRQCNVTLPPEMAIEKMHLYYAFMDSTYEIKDLDTLIHYPEGLDFKHCDGNYWCRGRQYDYTSYSMHFRAELDSCWLPSKIFVDNDSATACLLDNGESASGRLICKERNYKVLSYKYIPEGEQDSLQRVMYLLGENYRNKKYTWAEAQTACPNGWHIPTRKDMDLLEKVESAEYFDRDFWIQDESAKDGALFVRCMLNHDLEGVP